MDSKGFFLGLIAAIVLFLLWKKEQASMAVQAVANAISAPPVPAPAPCATCGGGTFAAAPSAQAMVSGTDGQISPGAPPLNGSAGVGSFYAPSGPTPDTGFTSLRAPTIAPVSGIVKAGTFVANVPGSNTTPANQPPLRSVQPVPSYTENGFVDNYNVSGVPRKLLVM